MKLSLELLQKKTLPQVFERGKALFEQKGSIPKLIKRDTIYEAEVKGSSLIPYQTAIDLGGADMQATCNCPYSQKGFCKHILAVGFAILAGAFEETEGPTELKLSFENIRNIKKDIRTTGNAAGQRDRMNLRLEQEQYMDAMKILLGIYESDPQQFRGVWQQAEQELAATFQTLSLPFPLAKEMISLIFDRWRKSTGSFQKQEDGITFALQDWGHILLVLAKEDVPKRFLQIRLQGFGLTADFLKK